MSTPSTKEPVHGKNASIGLDDTRARISDVDQKLLELLATRRGLSLKVAETKQQSGQPVRDTSQERKSLVSMIRRGRDLGLDAHLVTRLFQGIIEDSVLLQQASLHARENAEDGSKLKRVAFLGGAGSYSQAACQKYFARRAGKIVELGCDTFEGVFKKAESGEADYAVLPIENSTSGSINDVYDLLQHTGLSIVGEVTHKIEHCLLAADPDQKIEQIKALYVHPQVHAQCSHFLARLGDVEIVYCESTSHAMERVADAGPEAAAIGSREAGALWGLYDIKSDLANQRQNHTRFIIVARTPATVPESVPAKTTLVLSVDQKPGALVDALLVFRNHGINMLKLESRPLHGNPWEELFYIDLLGNARDSEVRVALDDLARRTRFLKVLGCYPSEDVAPTEISPDQLRHDVQAVDLAAGKAAKITTEKAPEKAKADAAPVAAAPKGWKLASRQHKPDDTVIHVGSASIGKGFTVIAGPCSVESAEQVMACAAHVRANGATLLRGGCFKPRTNPYSFQGLGFEGLDLLKQAGDRHGLPIVTEVLSTDQVLEVAKHSDILQIGARNMQNFPLLKLVGRTHRPVLLKRGMMASLDELLQAAEYILSEGNQQVILCERGIRTFEPATRNTLDLSAVPLLKQMSHLPVIVDPSHAVGRRDMVIPMARAAKAVGADGLIVEFHPNPEVALSDGPQALTFPMFEQMMEELA
ncbi:MULTISPECIES: bifunctional 3-deoxy-7-phosphoheptulonate synthase/chorismate mutase [unclassified Iodidimonas]|jgi:chorismate mutase/prephenate dehydratase|uniref:bifunctional 3-deoxy-7-phosphoheptulonate synthase/chorismate mutase n=1 Tax=unclassified Iodidimonas TaxID=2626145 RepID=UPI002482A02C|nr:MULTISPECIES: bifunctional 3-deoxy-7-phosphoheptulonate synthase/chorismate mutase [unclassified Iodidimonas]